MITQRKNEHEFCTFSGGNKVPHLKTLRKTFFPLTNTYVKKNS